MRASRDNTVVTIFFYYQQLWKIAINFNSKQQQDKKKNIWNNIFIAMV